MRLLQQFSLPTRMPLLSLLLLFLLWNASTAAVDAVATTRPRPPQVYSTPPPQQPKQQQHQYQQHPRRILQQQEQESETSTTNDSSSSSSTASSSSTTSSSSSEAARIALRRKLLTGYDRTIFPFEHVWNNQQQEQQQTGSTNEDESIFVRRRQGIPIELGLNFHRVFEVDVTNSVADLVVWVRQRWIDPRLIWNPMEYNNISTMHFWIQEGSGPGGETSQLWTPDLELWNLEQSLATSLVDTHAVVEHTGSVFWSRPGHVRPVCKFQGLEYFPFDTLDCTLEIGSWSFSGLYIRPIKMGEDGFTVGGSETAGEAFSEFSLRNISCEELIYPPYPNAPEEDWPVILYQVSFQRSWQPYARGYLVLQIVLNLAAFCCFWLPPHIGERMSLSITALLAAVASELVVAANLPAASELTWFSKFSLISLLFAAASLFESSAVIYFHYKTSDDCVPRFVRLIQSKVCNTKKKVSSKEAKPSKTTTTTTNDMSQQQQPQLDDNESDNQEVPPDESESSKRVDFVPLQPPPRDEVGVESSDSHVREDEDDNDHFQMAPPFPSPPPSSSSSPEQIRFKLPHGRPFKSKRGSLSKDFNSFRTRKSVKTILGRDADDFKNSKEMENNAEWQKVAIMIDEIARVIFPVAFAIFLGITLSSLP